MTTWKNRFVFPAHQFTGGGLEDQTKRREVNDITGKEHDPYALPLCLRKLANRNNDIFTTHDRLTKITKSNYVDRDKTWKHTDTKILPQKPQFTRWQCLKRVTWRIVTLDSFISRKVAYLFTLAGTVIITMVTTLMYGLQQIETQSLENPTQAQSAFQTWANSFWLVLLAIAILGVCEFAIYAYNVCFKSQQQLLKELRFDYAVTNYTRHNPYSPEYTNMFNGANNQDPDAVLVWLMDDEEMNEHDERNVKFSKRVSRCCSRFFLFDFVRNPRNNDINELGEDVSNV